jgi:tRNA(Arg) A34 adenosine deaminase TadA
MRPDPPGFTEHSALVRQCYALADEAVANGNHPFGALLLVDGRVAFTSRNEAVTSGDRTRHAEMNLLTKALGQLSPETLEDAVLYSSTEPCMMCAAAIYWSGLTKVVFGCSAAALGAVAGNDFLVPCREVFEKGERRIEVIGPVLEQEGLAKHRAYWSRSI